MKRFVPTSVAAITLAAAFAIAAPAFGEAAESTAQTTPPATSQENKRAPNAIDLPAAFYKAVRGCTTDGYIYRLTYHLTVNIDELAAPSATDTPLRERSLLERLTQPNPESVLGVSGTDRFMEELKALTGDIHSSMQVLTGQLIDEASAEMLEEQSFKEIVALAAAQITEDIREKYGVTVTILPDSPRQQAGRCEPAAPPARLPQQPPASAPQP